MFVALEGASLVNGSRAGVLALVGVATAGALSLGVAAPANAVDVAPLSSYMLTVPPSVYSASAGYSTTEQVAWREIARAGTDPKPPTVPVSPSKSWGIVAGVQALWLGGSAIVSNLGTFGTVLGVSPDQLTQRYAEQGLTAAEGFQCESLEGDWLGDLVTGVNDWFQSLFGVDCAGMRDGTLQKNPAYVPLAVDDPLEAGYPRTTGGDFGATQYRLTVHQPYWDSRPTPTGVDAATRVIGWVWPVSMPPGTQTTTATLKLELVKPDGTVYATYTPSFNAAGTTGKVTGSTHPECATVNLGCFEFSNFSSGTTQAVKDSLSLMTRITQATLNGSSNNLGTKALGVVPYVNPLDGSTYAPASQEQVFLTTVETQDGNRYTCRTEPFLETDVDVPTPCEPTVPGDEWIISRIVEMIPATSTDWVSGSDPRRVMTDHQAPPEYEDWKTAHPMCATTVCKMDLIKNGLGSCFQMGDSCDGWLSDPNRASAYTCLYNGSTIALSECEAGYPNVFNQTARDLGQAYPQPNDPATGQPSTGGQTSTLAGPTTLPGSQPLPPNQPRNCFPTGWNAFNPFQWVYQPVRCALEWAFVPRQEALTLTTMGISTAFNASSMGQLSGALAAVVAVLPGDGGCGGIPFSYDMRGVHVEETLLYSCSGPLAPAAGVTKSILTGSVIVAALLACTRYVATVFGFVGYGNAQQERAAAADARKAGKS